jgi:predicted Rossmann fold flavoprotein
MEKPDVVVIGAGPAGLSCAIHASADGCRVLVLEKNPVSGAKLLLSGSGQCNITHEGDIRDFFTHYGGHGKFLKPALLSFSNRDLLEFYRGRGLAMMAGENGKVFPGTRQAADVLAVLLKECEKRGVSIRYSEPVTEVSRTAESFTVITDTARYKASIVVITTGGASYPQCGTTGDGYRLAASLGQPVTWSGSHSREPCGVRNLLQILPGGQRKIPTGR